MRKWWKLFWFIIWRRKLWSLKNYWKGFLYWKKAILSNMLTSKSRAQYKYAYSVFFKWKDDNKAKTIVESIFKVYFKKLSVKFKLPSLWSVWSKFRTTHSLKHGIIIKQFIGLLLEVCWRADVFLCALCVSV